MLYKPSTKINFDIHKGFAISKIYQFNPSYLEWAIKYVSIFEIDINEFNKLPKPTPYFKNYFLYNIKGSEYGYAIDSNIPDAEKFIADGNKIDEIDFAFSEFSVSILEEKKKGIYDCPKYMRVTHEIIKIEDLF